MAGEQELVWPLKLTFLLPNPGILGARGVNSAGGLGLRPPSLLFSVKLEDWVRKEKVRRSM